MEKEMREKFVKLTLGELAERIAYAEQRLEREGKVLYQGEYITNKETLRAKMKYHIMEDLYGEVDHIHKTAIVTEVSPEDIKEDFEELVKDIEQASKDNPEDDFLQDILDCIRKGGF